MGIKEVKTFVPGGGGEELNEALTSTMAYAKANPDFAVRLEFNGIQVDVAANADLDSLVEQYKAKTREEAAARRINPR